MKEKKEVCIEKAYILHKPSSIAMLRTELWGELPTLRTFQIYNVFPVTIKEITHRANYNNYNNCNMFVTFNQRNSFCLW